MKAKVVKCYQAVYLNRKLDTMFPNMNHKSVDIQFLEGIGVRISIPEDSIIVPYPNVAYVQLEVETEEKKAVKKGA